MTGCGPAASTAAPDAAGREDQDPDATRRIPPATSRLDQLRSLSEPSAALARAEDVRALGETSRNALEPLVQALEDPDALVRGSAVIALLEREPAGVLGALDRAWSERRKSGQSVSPNSESRLLEFELIARVPMTETLPSTGQHVCSAVLEERDALVRSRALSACLRSGGATRKWLGAMADDASWAVRTRLAHGLGERAEKSLFERDLLVKLSSDRHPTVREAARRARVHDPS